MFEREVVKEKRRREGGRVRDGRTEGKGEKLGENMSKLIRFDNK